ncbi:MAG TPA: chorismate mutase [Candidatus Ozemobacteraceae bacterium]|nr:chorismate mutase [Candidatus Ozemobacteraceae bacterium]
MTEQAPSERLAELRREIDEIDARIVALLDRRAAVASDIGSRKAAAGIASPFDQAREEEVLRRVRNARCGPFPEDVLLELYRGIITACRNLQNG